MADKANGLGHADTKISRVGAISAWTWHLEDHLSPPGEKMPLGPSYGWRRGAVIRVVRNDPKVSRALALFKGKRFREASMQRLMEITRELSEIFASEIRQDMVLDLHLNDAGEENGLAPEREGIDNEALIPEIDRIVRGEGAPRRGVRHGSIYLNVAADEHFPPIDMVVDVPRNRAAHAAIAGEIRLQAQRMRTWLESLGLRLESRPHRARGRAIDRARLARAITIGDPRMLVSREPVRRADLFIGVMIDCSTSMATGGSIERARRFGVLIAEATHGLPGVDARFIGFTDDRILDAGDEDRCAVASLVAGGGNNDAAALVHAAGLAASSRRRARLLVMISDGLPTECSVNALRRVVWQTTRAGIACAQVAVRPLEEVCFPHYVEIHEGSMSEAVERFGRVVGRIVSSTLMGA